MGDRFLDKIEIERGLQHPRRQDALVAHAAKRIAIHVEIVGLEKKRIVENFQKIVPALRVGDSREIRKCGECGDPSRSEICNACKIFGCLS